MESSAGGPISDGDRIGLCLDVDGTIHRHGSIFVEALALLPYASDLAIEESERDALEEALGTVAGYASGDRSRQYWLGVLRVCDIFARLGLDTTVAHVLARLIRYGARQASDDPSTGETRDYREIQRRILDRYGQFLSGRRHDQVERAFEQVVGEHLRVEPSIRQTLEGLSAGVDLDVVLITDVPTHIAHPYTGLLGEEITAVGTDFTTVEGRFTGEYTFMKKGVAVEQLRAERGWDYTLTAGDSGNDLPMAAAADLFVAVAGPGNVGEELPSDYRTIDADTVRSAQLSAETDAIRVPRGMKIETALKATFAALGIEANE